MSWIEEPAPTVTNQSGYLPSSTWRTTILHAPLLVACTHCKRQYKLRSELVSERGVRVTCRHCGTRFVVHRESPSQRRLPPVRARDPGLEVTEPMDGAGDMAPTEPIPSRLTPLRVWIFPDDPALQRPGVLPCLKAALSEDKIQLLTEGFRQVICEHFWPPLEDASPHVVVFGETHVQTRDPLLQRISTRFGVHRVLVSLDPSEAPLRAARGFCGIDRRLTVPLDPALVPDALTPSAR